VVDFNFRALNAVREPPNKVGRIVAKRLTGMIKPRTGLRSVTALDFRWPV
jgi:hypothetical protein